MSSREVYEKLLHGEATSEEYVAAVYEDVAAARRRNRPRTRTRWERYKRRFWGDRRDG